MNNNPCENLSLAVREQRQIQEEILQGKYGQPDEIFMTTRALATLRHISVVTAHAVLTGLCADGYLELRGKRYYLSYADILRASEEKTKIIGLLIRNLNNEFFSSLAEAVNTAAVKRGYKVLLMSVAYSSDEEEQAVQTLLTLPISGIISCVKTAPKDEHIYNNSPIPCVMLAHSLTGGKTSSVQVNSFSISQKVAQYLIDEGYKKFLYIGSSNCSLENDDRFAAFQMVLRQHCFSLDEDSILQVSIDSNTGNSQIKEKLQSQTEPVGIFCYHDLIAAQLYHICRSIGKRIPDDVGIVGFDDLSVATLMAPALTTVQYRIETMADMAVNLLDTYIKTPDAPHDNYYIEPNLVIRESAARFTREASIEHSSPDSLYDAD